MTDPRPDEDAAVRPVYTLAMALVVAARDQRDGDVAVGVEHLMGAVRELWRDALFQAPPPSP